MPSVGAKFPFMVNTEPFRFATPWIRQRLVSLSGTRSKCHLHQDDIGLDAHGMISLVDSNYEHLSVNCK